MRHLEVHVVDRREYSVRVAFVQFNEEGADGVPSGELLLDVLAVLARLFPYPRFATRLGGGRFLEAFLLRGLERHGAGGGRGRERVQPIEDGRLRGRQLEGAEVDILRTRVGE